jgi:hypothetical protein
VTDFLLKSSGIFATTLPVLIAVIACVVCLALRALAGTFVLNLSRRATIVLNGLIVVLVVAFFVLVVIRFKVVG